MTRVLAIDPGTSCGYAYTNENAEPHPALVGWWDLRPRRHEGGGMRYVRFHKHLVELDPGVVFYEEVAAHKGVAAAHVYGGLVATLQSYCEKHDVPYQGVPVATIKRHATGKGNASKDQMHAAAVLKLGMASEHPHDVADAMWLLALSLAELSIPG